MSFTFEGSSSNRIAEEVYGVVGCIDIRRQYNSQKAFLFPDIFQLKGERLHEEGRAYQLLSEWNVSEELTWIASTLLLVVNNQSTQNHSFKDNKGRSQYPSHLTSVRNCCVRTSSVRTKLSAPEWASRWEKIRIHRCRCSYCNKDGSRKGFSRKKAILFFFSGGHSVLAFC